MDPVEITNLIHVIRGQRVMLDSDLAFLYDVPTKSLNLAVKRNIERFPADFSFVLSKNETASLRFQLETSNTGRGGRRHPPRVFTEHGVAMLSSVLNSSRAVRVNLEIIRAFIRFRRALLSNAELSRRLAAVEKTLAVHQDALLGHTAQIERLLEDIRSLLESPQSTRKRIGFIP
ncbi:MAG: ORF6N domain-containing protein [Elusimicrobiota bacterium]|jgi:hypothetical protein